MRLAWVIAALNLAAFAVIGVVGFIVAPTDPFPVMQIGAAEIGFTLSGAVLATRVRGNAIGPWLLAAASLVTIYLAAAAYDTSGSNAVPAPLPGTSWAALIESVSFIVPIVIVLVIVPLIFPTGTLLSPRWRIVVALGVASLVASTIDTALSHDPVGNMDLESPLATDGLDGLLGILNTAAPFTAVLAVAGAVVSLLVRWRRAGRAERAQLKWLIAVASTGAVALTASAFVISRPASDALFAVFVAAWIALPVAIGVAVLRYRLYAIDRIVSRSIGWLIVTSLLVSVFAAGVVALQAVLSGFMQGQTIAVAGSTLLAFTLFQPMRRRVQRSVDRRFDRGRYDAQLTADAFAERLRSDTAIDLVTADLEETVEVAVRPAVHGLWLREIHR